jgi:hypothetical protein
VIEWFEQLLSQQRADVMRKAHLVSVETLHRLRELQQRFSFPPLDVIEELEKPERRRFTPLEEPEG